MTFSQLTACLCVLCSFCNVCRWLFQQWFAENLRCSLFERVTELLLQFDNHVPFLLLNAAFDRLCFLFHLVRNVVTKPRIELFLYGNLATYSNLVAHLIREHE